MRSGWPDYPRANAVALEAGYSAPYLHLLEDDFTISSRNLTRYSQKKLNQVARAIRTGAGQGFGDNYQPWIRIRRNFSSPVSYQVLSSVAINARNHHFLSQLEFHTALLCSFAGATDLRECLPLWPAEHPHPGFEEGYCAPLVPGLLDISRQLGIDHGCFVGTSVPYVASIDLVFRPPVNSICILTGISCKPRSITDRSSRAQERIGLDAGYCRAIGARHIHEDGTSIDPIVIRQLLWLVPTTKELRLHRGTSKLADFAAIFTESSTHQSITDAAIHSGKRVGLNFWDSFLFFRLSFWIHLIDIDVTREIDTTKPRIGDGGSNISRWRNHYFGCIT